MQTTHSTEDYAIPGIGSLPLIGNLFKSQQKIDSRSELVILLRPMVIEADEQWNSMTGEPRDPNAPSVFGTSQGQH
jgi:MSHA biogenesis protein MshL